MCQLPGQEKWKVFGIGSWVHGGCGNVFFSGVFTRVIHYLGWIQNIMDQEN